MSYVQKELSGSIFKNTRKESPNHPDLSGTALINGKHYWVSGWKKTDKNGDAWVSLAFKEKDFAPAKQALKTNDFDDSDIPF